ncbi:MAG: hydroxyquinol 1,2-dioxygenase [Acidisphaera sp.]|nr:hydroxyquinol 1,2-dioxygenase [Acidisphaera sp.]
MQDLDQYTVTDATLAQMAQTPNPRLREIMDAAVRHLHAFAREVSLTPAEWLAGMKFLTAVGHACTPFRQEFILLSDVLGLSSLVNAMHDARAGEDGTQTSLLGPFYREAAPSHALGESIAGLSSGEEMVLFGNVLDAAGRGVPHASVQVWQTNAEGLYDLQLHEPEQMDMRGCFACDGSGAYHFRTIRPRGYMIPMDGPVGGLVQAQRRHGYRPAHIHFLIGAPGHRELVTALYLADDAHIDSDTVFGVSQALVVRPSLDLAGSPRPDLASIRYDFRLSRTADGGSGRVGADPSKILEPAP